MSMLSELGTYLTSQVSIGGTVGTDVFEGLLPATPNNCWTLMQRPGRNPVRTMADTIVANQPFLQVIVRNEDYEAGDAKLAAIAKVLQNFRGTLGTTRYLTITLNGDLYALGTDENRLYLFSANFAVMRKAA